jgi:hypothetical protein
MKKEFTYYIAITALGVCSQFVTAQELPYDVKVLEQQRNQAVAKIDATYRTELEKMKIKYTKLGDLETANKIASLLKNLETNPSAPNVKDDFGVVGKWVFKIEGKKRNFNFSSDMSFTGQYTTGQDFSGTWKVEDKTIILVVDGKKSDIHLKFTPNNQLLYVGRWASMAGERR